MIESTPEVPLSARRSSRVRSERSRSEVPFSIVGSVFGVIFIWLALVWVMNLEATLPSIRVGDRQNPDVAGQTLEPGEYSAENRAIALTGDWFQQTIGTNGSSSVASLVVTASSGSVMSFRFYGTDLAISARIGPESGKVYVSIDGNPSRDLPADAKGSYLDLFAEQAEDQSVLIASGLSHRDHVVTITSDGTNQVAIGGFTISANTPFPWAFVFLYVALAAALFVLVRISVVGVCRQLGWIA